MGITQRNPTGMGIRLKLPNGDGKKWEWLHGNRECKKSSSGHLYKTERRSSITRHVILPHVTNRCLAASDESRD